MSHKVAKAQRNTKALCNLVSSCLCGSKKYDKNKKIYDEADFQSWVTRNA